MTPEEFTTKLPALSSDELPIKPPFEFRGLSARVFPLRASLDALQQLTNDYLNFIPREIGRFRAVVPYAYLAILDYGQITEHVMPLGWFAQVEVFFCVPVEWYRVVNGKWVFHDWAVFTPYIYVSDDLSVPMGRTVYGFPKTLAYLAKPGNEWLHDPMSPVSVAKVETGVFREMYNGQRLESRVFLEVEREAPTSNFRTPFDPRVPTAPWVIASNLAQAMAGFGRDAMGLAQSMRISPIDGATDPAFAAAMIERIMPAFAPGGSGFVLNSLNLKQFPRSESPLKICYQALTNGRMQATALNGGGLLGEERTFFGDLSGGYTIKLHEYASLPIARTLGLEVDRRWRGDGVDVVSLKPVTPFWLDVNVLYQQGMNLAWRTRDGIWRGGNGEALDSSEVPASEGDSPKINRSVCSAVDSITGPFRFTDTTIRVLPLLAKRTKVQDFLDTHINNALCAYQDPSKGTKIRLSVWARPPVENDVGETIGGDYAYVYMTASSFGGVTSKTNNIGDWAKHELSMLIPVKLEREEDKDWKVIGVGLVPAFSFVNDTIAAVSRAEVHGIPTTRATFVRPESVWLGTGETDVGGPQVTLRLEAEVIPALGVGQKTIMRPVIEISQRDSGAGIGEASSHATPAEWAKTLLEELDAKKRTKKTRRSDCNIARALALELLGNKVPVSLYTLKQFRDVADPTKACYQSLVRVSRLFDEVLDLREIEETIRVRIHDFPTLKLVESLGIWAKTLGEEGGGVTYGTQAIRPFYIHATIDEPFGERLLSRAGTLTWEHAPRAFDSLLSDHPAQKINVDRQAEREQDQGDPCRMGTIAYESAQRRQKDGQGKPEEPPLTVAEESLLQTSAGTSPKDHPAAQMEAKPQIDGLVKRHADWEEWRFKQRISKGAARRALERIDPQMVIESILSREWGNFDKNARWRRGREELAKARDIMLTCGPVPFATLHLKDVSKDTLTEAVKLGREDFAAVERALFGSIRSDTANRPGRPRMGAEVDEMIEGMSEFTTLRLEMEHHFSILAAWSIIPTFADEMKKKVEGNVKELDIGKTTRDLVEVMGKIAERRVIGQPSHDDNVERLIELLKAIKKETGPPSKWTEPPLIDGDPWLAAVGEKIKKWQSTQFQDFLSGQTGKRVWGMIDQIREAARRAEKYCNLQREALLNTLSRAYQKPDFCIRRDSVGPEADALLPIALSWDPEWYYGITSDDDPHANVARGGDQEKP